MSAEPYTEAEIEDQRAYVSQEFDLYAAHVERNRRWLATVDSLRAELAEAKAMVLARFHPVPVTAADLAQAREFIEPYERGRLAGIEQAAKGGDKRGFIEAYGHGWRAGRRQAFEDAQNTVRNWSGRGMQHATCGKYAADQIWELANPTSSPASGSGGSPPSASPEWDGSPWCEVCGGPPSVHPNWPCDIERALRRAKNKKILETEPRGESPTPEGEGTR
jgi:hypothetical protein